MKLGDQQQLRVRLWISCRSTASRMRKDLEDFDSRLRERETASLYNEMHPRIGLNVRQSENTGTVRGSDSYQQKMVIAW